MCGRVYSSPTGGHLKGMEERNGMGKIVGKNLSSTVNVYYF